MFPLRRLAICLVVFGITLILLGRYNGRLSLPSRPEIYRLAPSDDDARFHWAHRKENYPVTDYIPIPPPSSKPLPTVQHAFDSRKHAKNAMPRKQAAVKAAMKRCWKSYHERAWLRDELAPISGGHHDTFGGWAATLVDSLDTLWIMDMREEFAAAVDAAVDIDFGRTSQGQINVFETTIRYLGGFLAAYDLSSDRRLLDKALELATMLYAAFDTPNRMPITRWDFALAASGVSSLAPDSVLLAEIGSLSLEFTRLAQLTNDARWYDAVARVTDAFDRQQNLSGLPGMWPMVVNARDEDFGSGNFFTLGAMADSMYEYLPKMYALLGGSEAYRRMYEVSMNVSIEHNLFRPMTPDDADVLMAGPAVVEGGRVTTRPEGQHLVCFAGGMLALGGRLVDEPAHVELGRKLTDGCVWAYEHSPLGIMPETYTVVACEGRGACVWNETRWHEDVERRADGKNSDESVGDYIERNRLSPGFSSIDDRRYVLRPEAIESVFYLWRITGDRRFQETAWRMFENIERYSKTEFGNAEIRDISDPAAPKTDSMESFWTAETLKYFYLIFSEPSLISLDDYVFNTEAHPFKRPVVRRDG